jgi:uncharacterized membrane protein YcaP (DUF421 family)
MDSVISGTAVYLSVLVFTRITGRRTLAQTTVFDIVLLLLLAEAAQGYLLRDDPSFTNFVIVLATFGVIDVTMSYLKLNSVFAQALIDGAPTVLMRDGVVLEDRLRRTRVTKDDIIEAARMQHGVATWDEIEAAVLETGGGISVICKRRS